MRPSRLAHSSRAGSRSISRSSAIAGWRRSSIRAPRLVWWCFPRFDSNPVFSRLLSGDEEKGFCDVVLADLGRVSSGYVHNTAIVETELEDNHGGRVRITDFAPRFMRYERMFHPPQLVRRIVPLAGLPRIAIRVRPTEDYGRAISDWTVGSNHIRYHSGGTVMRLSTDAPLSYITQETTFTLARPLTLFFGSGRALSQRPRRHRPGVRGIHAAVLARLGALARDPVRMAGRGDPRGDHSQALQFRGNGRHRRRAYDVRSRGAEQRPELGLSILLAPRRLLRRPGAQQARRHRDDGSLPQLYHDGRVGPEHTAEAGSFDRARRTARRAYRARSRRLPRPGTGSRRQSRRRADPARRLRQRDPGGDADVHR